MNKKFRKLLSGVIYSVGIMSSLVCPCAQAKWGEGTHAMTDDEFNAFYKKFGLDAFKYFKNHTDVADREADGTADKTVNEFDKQNNLLDASFLDTMKNYCKYYQLSLGDKNKFSNCRVVSFVVIDYFQKNNIKSAYLQIGCYSLTQESHDVVAYEGKDGKWFVADISLFFDLIYGNKCEREKKKVKCDSNIFELLFGFKKTDIKYSLRYPLRDYINRFADNYLNYVLVSENNDKGGYRGVTPLEDECMFLPYWVKNSGACDKSFVDEFLINEGVTVDNILYNAEKLKFVSPIRVVKDSKAQKYGGSGFMIFKGIDGNNVEYPLV